MDKETILSKITEIGTCEDEATRRTLLTELGEDVENVFNNVDTLTQQNSELTTANNTLRDANTALFLRVNVKDKPDPDPGEDPEPKPKPRSLIDIYYNKK